MDTLMDWLQGLPSILKIALPVLLILMVGAIVRKLLKYAVIIALLILAIVFIYPFFDY